MVAPADAAADHAAAGQDGFDLALGARSHVGVDQPPLPATAEPDPPGGLEWSDERLGVGFRSIPSVQHGHVASLRTAGRRSPLPSSASNVVVLGGRRDQHEFGVGAPGQGDELLPGLRASRPRRRSPAIPTRARPPAQDSPAPRRAIMRSSDAINSRWS